MVGDDDRDVVGLEDLERLLAAVGAQDTELGGENRFERVEYAGLVVHDEHGRWLQPSSWAVRAASS